MGRDVAYSVAASGTVPDKPKKEAGTRAYQRFLAMLDPDPIRAAEKYQSLRRKLVTMMRSRRCPRADELADESIDRIVRTVAEDRPILDVPRFAYGVARHVLGEYWRSEEGKWLGLETLPRSREPMVDPELPASATGSLEFEYACLAHCLGTLNPEDRTLITEYYRGEGRSKIDHRSLLAKRAGTRRENLSLRLHRIRRKLAVCVKDCVHAGGVP